MLSQTLRKKDDGLRLRRRALLRDQRPRDLRGAEEQLRPDRQHGQRRRSTWPPTWACCAWTAPWSASAPRREPLPVPVFALFGNRRSFAGSGIGGIGETQEMLDFCAEREHRPRRRGDRRRRGQRGVRAGARLRRALPVRHRHRHPALTPPGGLRRARNAAAPSLERGTGPQRSAESGAQARSRAAASWSPMLSSISWCSLGTSASSCWVYSCSGWKITWSTVPCSTIMPCSITST